MAGKNEFSRAWKCLSQDDSWAADTERARTKLADFIANSIDQKWGTAIAAERATGIAHTELSRIRNGKLARYTVDRLARLLHLLDPDVEVRVEIKVKRRRSNLDEPECSR